MRRIRLVSRRILFKPEINERRLSPIFGENPATASTLRVSIVPVDLIPYQGMQLRSAIAAMFVGPENAIEKVAAIG